MEIEFEIKLKEVRKNKNLTLEQLSKMTYISKGYLSEIENGKQKNIGLCHVCKLLKALECNFYDLVVILK